MLKSNENYVIKLADILLGNRAIDFFVLFVVINIFFVFLKFLKVSPIMSIVFWTFVIIQFTSISSLVSSAFSAFVTSYTLLPRPRFTVRQIAAIIGSTFYSLVSFVDSFAYTITYHDIGGYIVNMFWLLVLFNIFRSVDDLVVLWFVVDAALLSIFFLDPSTSFE